MTVDAGPFVFPPLGRHLVGDGDGHSGRQLRQRLRRGELVVGIQVGEQKSDGRRADAFRPDAVRRPPDIVAVERDQLTAVVVEPPSYGDDVPAGDERSGFAVTDVVHVHCGCRGRCDRRRRPLWWPAG